MRYCLKYTGAVTLSWMKDYQYTAFIPQLQQLEYYARIGNVADELRTRYLISHLDTESYNDMCNNIVILKEDKDRKNFLQSLNSHLTTTECSVRFIRFISPDELTKGRYSSYVNTSRREQNMAFYGVDNLIDCVALINVDGREYVFMLSCGCWDGKWYAITGHGDLAAILGLDNNYVGLIPADLIDF